jgi:uncharacterized protein YbjQ (UPF0145 family)
MLEISKTPVLPRGKMLFTTTDHLQGIVIREYLGVVTAEVIYGTNAFRDFFAGIRDFVGGRTGAYEEVLQKGHQQALEELGKRARRMGAEAVIGIRFQTSSINLDETGVLMMVTATGTAIKL